MQFANCFIVPVRSLASRPSESFVQTLLFGFCAPLRKTGRRAGMGGRNQGEWGGMLRLGGTQGESSSKRETQREREGEGGFLGWREDRISTAGHPIASPNRVRGLFISLWLHIRSAVHYWLQLFNLCEESQDGELNWGSRRKRPVDDPVGLQISCSHCH